jgi:hypothetical protein
MNVSQILEVPTGALMATASNTCTPELRGDAVKLIVVQGVRLANVFKRGTLKVKVELAARP